MSLRRFCELVHHNGKGQRPEGDQQKAMKIALDSLSLLPKTNDFIEVSRASFEVELFPSFIKKKLRGKSDEKKFEASFKNG